MNPAYLRLLERYPDLLPCLPDIEAAHLLLERCFDSGGKVLVCGNGGSAADSEHLVGELMKGFLLKRPVPDEFRRELAEAFPAEAAWLADRLQGALPAIALTQHSALGTAFANDVCADTVFAQQVYGYGRPGDLLVGFSTSGNSANVLHALRVGRVLGLRTLGFTGAGGGRIKALCDVTIRAPYESTPEIQERHLPIYHALSIAIEAQFFGKASPRA